MSDWVYSWRTSFLGKEFLIQTTFLCEDIFNISLWYLCSNSASPTTISLIRVSRRSLANRSTFSIPLVLLSLPIYRIVKGLFFSEQDDVANLAPFGVTTISLPSSTFFTLVRTLLDTAQIILIRSSLSFNSDMSDAQLGFILSEWKVYRFFSFSEEQLIASPRKSLLVEKDPWKMVDISLLNDCFKLFRAVNFF